MVVAIDRYWGKSRPDGALAESGAPDPEAKGGESERADACEGVGMPCAQCNSCGGINEPPDISRSVKQVMSTPRTDGDTRATAPPRSFPPPWTVEETEASFIVKDQAGRSLAYVYFEEEPGLRAAAFSPKTTPVCGFTWCI